MIHSALENVLLSKVKNVSESVVEDFKNNLDNDDIKIISLEEEKMMKIETMIWI